MKKVGHKTHPLRRLDSYFRKTQDTCVNRENLGFMGCPSRKNCVKYKCFVSLPPRYISARHKTAYWPYCTPYPTCWDWCGLRRLWLVCAKHPPIFSAVLWRQRLEGLPRSLEQKRRLRETCAQMPPMKLPLKLELIRVRYVRVYVLIFKGNPLDCEGYQQSHLQHYPVRPEF